MDRLGGLRHGRKVNNTYTWQKWSEGEEKLGTVEFVWRKTKPVLLTVFSCVADPLLGEGQAEPE